FWVALPPLTTRSMAVPIVIGLAGVAAGVLSWRGGHTRLGWTGVCIALLGMLFGAIATNASEAHLEVVITWSALTAATLRFATPLTFAAIGALVPAFFSIQLRSDQIVSGTAVNFLTLGITGFIYIDTYGNEGTPSDLPQVPDVNLDFLGSIPPSGLGNYLERAFGGLNLLVWLALATVVLAWIVIFKTTIGLRIRSVGENPRAE